MSRKVPVDGDRGVDDGQAVTMAPGAPGVRVLGIACVHGNTTVENVCGNTLRVLKVCNKPEVCISRMYA
ncbi:hypothetical protein CRUP_026715 [Coryphaenoides rupestris]|nr:hypothetical protein CRUP_026715 [Coryphaenoides rupestris]